MVTSKRRIERDEDRYGGFAAGDTYIEDATTEREFSDDILQMRSYVAAPERRERTETARPAEPEAPAPKKAEPEVRPVERPARAEETFARPEQLPERKNIRDLMPKIVSRKRSAEIERPAETPVVHEKKLPASAKKALIIYMTVVLAVVIGIIATGVAVSSVSAQVADFESTIAQQEETIASQREDLAVLSDDGAITARAEELGMVAIEEDDIGSYDRLEIGGNTEDESGVFDNIRDWFNSVFGG